MPAAVLTAATLEALRAATPGTRTTVHFNHAGASLPSAATLDAVQAHLRREAEQGPMEAGVAARAHTDQARQLAARLLNAQPGEIALTGGNSPGWGGNLAAMRLAAQPAGATIETIPSDDSGCVDADALRAMLDERVRLVALTWLPANGGLINPAAAIGRVTRAAGVPYFIDAAQAVGQVPIDVAEVGCDVLSGAGRKALRGPRGTGLLYVRREFLPRLTPAFVDTHSAPLGADGEPQLRDNATRFESAEASMALRAGLANALHEALDIGLEAIRARIDLVAQALRAELRAIAGIEVLDQGRELSGLVSFNLAGHDPVAVQRTLAAQGITIGSNGVPYTPLDMNARGLAHIARASVSYLTRDEEIDRLLDALRALSRQGA